MKHIKDISYAALPENTLDVYLPDGKINSAFLYFHGGGLKAGDKTDADIFAQYLCERGIVLISANYRMYPTAKYPEYILDAADAVAWAVKYVQQELNCQKLYIGGSSAGGYLTLMLCFNHEYLKNVGVDPDFISGYLHDAGMTTTHYNILREERGLSYKRIIVDEAAPLYYVGLAEKYPPMRFVTSDQDVATRMEQTMLMLATLTRFGYTGFDQVVMAGKHCAYCAEIDSDGVCVFAKMIYDFICHVEAS